MRVKIVNPNGTLVDSEVRMNDIVDVAVDCAMDGYILKYHADTDLWVCEPETPPAPVSYNDRGDAASWDFSKADLSTDGQWHVLNLSDKVPEGTTLIHLKIKAQIAYNNSIIAFCKNGSVNKLNGTTLMIRHGNNEYYEEVWVACDENRKIEYWMSNRTWVILDVMIRGYFA